MFFRNQHRQNQRETILLVQRPPPPVESFLISLSSQKSCQVSKYAYVFCAACHYGDRLLRDHLVRSLGAVQKDGAAGTRFLREHKVDGAASTEERGFKNFFRGETSKSKVVDKVVDPEAGAVQKLAKEVLQNPKIAKGAYIKWEHAGHTLDDLKKYLKIDEKDKYLSIYNGYVFHKLQD